eukprot:TRINITY_DN1202_c0_g2_i2.p1 TRINITY_DN1202_c0_g2~~TRINITY_DN1202_c0_g2_i2.p1  ORF type:complete len:103 (-),score=8.33 TRINITY_DN1202_c0_g2_i2:34-342(-)
MNKLFCDCLERDSKKKKLTQIARSTQEEIEISRIPIKTDEELLEMVKTGERYTYTMTNLLIGEVPPGKKKKVFLKFVFTPDYIPYKRQGLLNVTFTYDSFHK